MSYVDLSLVAESITWDSYSEDSFQLGQDYASSVGALLDFGGSAAHYVNYKLSFGVFQGFGAANSTQIVTQLRTGLNL